MEKEDYVVQPVIDVSPPKWHLGHTTWFFETFILVPNKVRYKLFHPDYGYVFNSYYETIGTRVLRTNRGNLTRPCVDEVLKYRAYVDEQILDFLNAAKEIPDSLAEVLELGLQHEQQHQELLLYDIKYILGHNPLFPPYKKETLNKAHPIAQSINFLDISDGTYEIGYDGHEFHFDNEKGVHKVHLHDFQIADRVVNNKEYLEFIEDDGYKRFEFWLSEAWDWVNKNEVNSPMYWHKIDGEWHTYSLYGLSRLELSEPLAHISYFEAEAFARWKGMRLPTEFEWEIAANLHANNIPDHANFVEAQNFKPIYGHNDNHFHGNLWEWTGSAYLPYPYFKAPPGAIGEYNGKFMINQMVLRGGSYATPKDHIRTTYRNFFHPHLQWLFAGIRLAKHV